MQKLSLSLTIPVFNEEQILKSQIDYLIPQLKKITNNFEVILVENGSTDASRQIADSLSKKYAQVQTIILKESDYGLALKTGHLKSSKEILANFSVDWMDFKFLKEALKKMDTYDLCIASKQVKNSKDNRPFIRKFGGNLYHHLVGRLFSLPIADTHGLKVMKKDKMFKVIKQCKFSKEAFEPELVIRANLNNNSIVEIPVLVKEMRAPRVKILSRAVNATLQLIKLRLNIFRENKLS